MAISLIAPDTRHSRQYSNNMSLYGDQIGNRLILYFWSGTTDRGGGVTGNERAQ